MLDGLAWPPQGSGGPGEPRDAWPRGQTLVTTCRRKGRGFPHTSFISFTATHLKGELDRAVLTDSMLRHRFGVVLERGIGGFSALNTIARLLVLTRRSAWSRASDRASPGYSQTQTSKTGPNTCREATHPSRAFLM